MTRSTVVSEPVSEPTTAVQDKLTPLLGSIAQQDNKAFETLYDATVSRVYGLALRIMRSHEAAEEVVCDVYLQVWRQASSFDARRGAAIAWLMMLCRSRALDALRRDKAERATEQLDEQNEVADADPYPQDLLAAVERNGELHAALKKLSDSQRQLLALAYFQGYSHRELADFTGIPLGTVKTQIRRGLLALKEHLAGSDLANGEQL